MKIIDIETEDIQDFKTIIEILNGFIPEANADFIKDAKAYSESLNKKRVNKNTSDGNHDGNHNDNHHNNSKSDQEYPNNDSENDSDIDKKDISRTVKTDRKFLKGKSPNIPDKTIKPIKSKKHIEEDISDDDTPKPLKSKSKSSKKEKKSKKSEDSDVDLNKNSDIDEKAKQLKDKKKKKKEIINEDEDEDEIKEKKKSKKDKKIKKQKNNSDSDADEDKKREENRGEIKILTADPNQVMITFIRLYGSAFKKFVVFPEKYSVGLNLDELFKYIKNVDKEGTMSIHIDSDDTQHIIFDVKSENSTSQESICELRVLNLSTKKDKRIETDVSMAVRINCQAFHKACKDLMQFSQFVEITCDPSQLAITCKGDLSNHKRIFKVDGTETGIAIKIVKNDDDTVPNIIRLVFDLKYINSMYKCASLCEDMEIYLNTDTVMFLKYGIKIIGEMTVGISPSRKKKEQTDNYDEADDEYYQDDDEIQLIK